MYHFCYENVDLAKIELAMNNLPARILILKDP